MWTSSLTWRANFFVGGHSPQQSSRQKAGERPRPQSCPKQQVSTLNQQPSQQRRGCTEINARAVGAPQRRVVYPGGVDLLCMLRPVLGLQTLALRRICGCGCGGRERRAKQTAEQVTTRRVNATPPLCAHFWRCLVCASRVECRCCDAGGYEYPDERPPTDLGGLRLSGGCCSQHKPRIAASTIVCCVVARSSG